MNKFTGKIKCSACQHEFGVRKDIYEQRITIFGSEEELIAKYVCQKCRTSGCPSAQTEVTKPTLPRISYIYTPPEKKKRTWPEIIGDNICCWYPSHFIDSGRCCNGCTIYEFCKYPKKNLKDPQKVAPKKSRYQK